MRTASEAPGLSAPGRAGVVVWQQALRKAYSRLVLVLSSGLAAGAVLALGPTLAAAQTPMPAVPGKVPTVFACEPEWAALVRVLLPRAQVHVATHARQDPHHIEARPALIAQLRTADLAVCTGAGLESGWLPMLQQRAANPRVQDGQAGLFFAADQVQLINPRPATLNPFAGDVHAQGNPHLHADPGRLAQVAAALAAHLARLWPDQAVEIGQRHADWTVRWQGHTARWQREGQRLQGLRVAAQHTTFGYLWHWLGMEMVADLEPRPGMPPTPGHLGALREQLRTRAPVAIVVASHQDARSAHWLARQLDPRSPVLVLPATVEDPDAPDALVRWFDAVLQALLMAADSRR